MSDTKPAVPETAVVPAAAQQIARADTKAPIKVTREGMQLETFEALWRFAATAVASGFAPRGFQKPEQVVIAVQYGAELGLRGPMTSLRSIHVINQQPSLAGQAALALCWQRGVFERVDEIVVAGDGDERHATFTARRKGQPRDFSASFSIADARRAGLLGKDNWKGSPDDMLTWRAVGRWMKRYAPDVIMGLPITEEAIDYPAPTSPTALPAPQPSGPGLLAALDAEDAAEAAVEPVEVQAQPRPEAVELAGDAQPEAAQAAPFDSDTALARLGDELASRVGVEDEHDEARQQLLAEVVAGMAMASADDFAEAHKRLRQHPVFGDAASNAAHCAGAQPALFEVPSRHDREPAAAKRGRR